MCFHRHRANLLMLTSSKIGTVKNNNCTVTSGSAPEPKYNWCRDLCTGSAYISHKILWTFPSGQVIRYKNVRSGRTCPGEIRPCRDEGCSGAARQGKPRSRRAAFAASVFGGALTGLVECSSSNKVSEIAVMVSSRSSEDC
jgi:hypothetical protein